MSFINASYFVGNINIPNAADAPISSRITWFINKYEPEFLRLALGYELYAAFVAGIAAESPDQLWLDLRDGKVYGGLDGYTYKYRGLIETLVPPIEAAPEADPPVEAVAGVYESMIANYVYWQYEKSIATQSAGIGEVIVKAENADNASVRQKMVSAWNNMADAVREMHCFLNTFYQDYPTWNYGYQSNCSLSRKVNIFGI